MRLWAVVAVLLGALAGACRESDGESGGGGEDKAACQVIRALEGENVGIYPDLLRMDLSAEMRTALTELRDSTTGGEIRGDTFARAGKVAALCAQNGVVLSG
jgi:hypothetical protein